MTITQEVLIIGGGVAGLSAALGLSQVGVPAVLVEKRAHLGGYAAQYACKAATACVKCGACMVMERIGRVAGDPRITVMTDSRVERIDATSGFETLITRKSDSDRARQQTRHCAAVVLACGFTPFDPVDKPYGYKRFDNVVTTLELERMLRRTGAVVRPSDGAPPERMAFVQCVGSRDSRLGHLWCSKICCASALRMARLIKTRRPQTEIACFYIDLQTFGQTFQRFYDTARKDIRMIRTLPGDVLPAPNNCLKAVYYDVGAAESREEPFDMLVLSIGITPAADGRELAAALGLPTSPSGFVRPAANGGAAAAAGVFAAGAVCGPMSIAESVAAGERAAQATAAFLRDERSRPSA